MFLLYEVMLHLVFFVTLPFFLVIGFLRGKYLTNFRDRFGHYSYAADAHDVWVHAVSVGEVMAAKTIVDSIRARRPDTSVVVTTTTITGQQTARRVMKNATVTYFPFDFTRSVERFLDHHDPRALLLVETEIWPNVSRLAARRGIPIILANGRISDRSFGRYRPFRFVVSPILRLYRRVLVREEIDRERFVAIGARADSVEVAGNVKFDYAPDPTPLELEEQVKRVAAGRPIVVVGSTVAGEDELLIPELRSLAAEGAFIVLAPRKPERFDVVDSLLAESGLGHIRRTEWNGEDRSGASVLLLDSIGELARLYRCAAAAFVGGSLLAGTGGHNPIEPAAVGVPVAFGPRMSNFREIAALFLRDGAAVETADASAVKRFLRQMITDRSAHDELSERARMAVQKNQGAAERIAAAVLEAL